MAKNKDKSASAQKASTTGNIYNCTNELPAKSTAKRGNTHCLFF